MVGIHILNVYERGTIECVDGRRCPQFFKSDVTSSPLACTRCEVRQVIAYPAIGIDQVQRSLQVTRGLTCYRKPGLQDRGNRGVKRNTG